MHLTFRVVLAVVAALTAFMAVSADADGGCHSGSLCKSKADCCNGYECVLTEDPNFDEVSMSSFIQDLLTYWYGSLT